MGFTATPRTETERIASRAAKRNKELKARYGVCRWGHTKSPDNDYWYETVRYCLPCVQVGNVTPMTLRWVYFIGDGAGHVKIGYSVAVEWRLREMQVCNASELRILGVLKGGQELEQALHKRFAEHHVRGEWFRLAPEIVDFIAENTNRKTAAQEVNA